MNNKQNLNISNYLVTEAVDPKTILPDKVNSDLEINKAEKSTYKTNIANYKKPKVQRAVSVLKLSNPFKGY